MLIYEDVLTGLRGKMALDRVLRRGDVMAHGNLSVWRMDMLDHPECQEEARRDALTADILMVSTHGNRGLPTEAEASLKQWINLKNGHPFALVISLDTPSQLSQDLSHSLRELRAEIKRNELAVLLQVGKEPWPAINNAMVDIRQRAHATAPPRQEIRKRPNSYRGWGINE